MTTIVMKGLSLWQPWASLWLTNLKIHETRCWKTPYRGWLVVHAAKHREPDNNKFTRGMKMDPDRLPYGAILGAVELVDCVKIFPVGADGALTSISAHYEDLMCGDWRPGRFAWRKGRCVTLPTPIPYRGRQSLFDIPIDDLGPLLDLIPADGP